MEEIIEALKAEALLMENDPKLMVNGHGEEWLIERIKDLLRNGPATMVVALNKKTHFCGVNKKLNHMGINCFTFNSRGKSMLFASYDANRTTAAASFIIDSTPPEEE